MVMETVTQEEWAEFTCRFRTRATEEFLSGGSKMHCILVDRPERIVVSTVSYGTDGKAYQYKINRHAEKYLT
jgi:hypothetical protein